MMEVDDHGVLEAAAGEDRTLEDLEADHLPAGETRGLPMFVPHPQRERGGVEQRVGLLPVLDLRAPGGVLQRVQERALVTEPAECVADDKWLDLVAGDRDGHIPDPWTLAHVLTSSHIPRNPPIGLKCPLPDGAP